MRRVRAVQTTAAVACLVVALSGCASQVGARSGEAVDREVGVHWTLVSVTKNAAKSVPMAAAPGAWLEVSSSHEISGRDGCAVFQAEAAGMGSTMTLSNVLGAANGCLDDHGALDATRAAVGGMLVGGPMEVAVSARRLTIVAGQYSLVYRNSGPASPPPPAPVSMTRTADDSRRASCVAPFLRADARRSPPPPGQPTSVVDVRVGQTVTVYGWWYYDGPCSDVRGRGQTITPAHPSGAIELRLSTSNGQTVGLAAPQPHGEDASFTATVTVPDTAATGPATITDGLGHIVKLVILES